MIDKTPTSQELLWQTHRFALSLYMVLHLSQGDAHGLQHQSFWPENLSPFCLRVFSLVSLSNSCFMNLSVRRHYESEKAKVVGKWCPGYPPRKTKWDPCVISWNLTSILISNPCCHLALSRCFKQVFSKDILEVKYFTIRNSLYKSVYTCRSNEKELSIRNCYSEKST